MFLGKTKKNIVQDLFLTERWKVKKIKVLLLFPTDKMSKKRNISSLLFSFIVFNFDPVSDNLFSISVSIILTHQSLVNIWNIFVIFLSIHQQPMSCRENKMCICFKNILYLLVYLRHTYYPYFRNSLFFKWWKKAQVAVKPISTLK